MPSSNCKDTVYAGVSSVHERHAEHYASMGRSDQLTKLFGREALRVRSMYALELQNYISGFEHAMAAKRRATAAECAFSAVHVIRFRGAYEQGLRMLALSSKRRTCPQQMRGRTLFHQAMLWKQKSPHRRGRCRIGVCGSYFRVPQQTAVGRFRAH